MNRRVEVRVLDPRIGADYPLPEYATMASAGMDLRAMINAPLTLEPGATALLPSGIAIHIGDADVNVNAEDQQASGDHLKFVDEQFITIRFEDRLLRPF